MVCASEEIVRVRLKFHLLRSFHEDNLNNIVMKYISLFVTKVLLKRPGVPFELCFCKVLEVIKRS